LAHEPLVETRHRKPLRPNPLAPWEPCVGSLRAFYEVRPPHLELEASGDVVCNRVTRQTGSHLRLTTQERGEHHITIPNHDPLRVGTLAGILADLADHFGLSRDDLAVRLFDAKS
jgi:hypothetical protein